MQNSFRCQYLAENYGCHFLVLTPHSNPTPTHIQNTHVCKRPLEDMIIHNLHIIEMYYICVATRQEKLTQLTT